MNKLFIHNAFFRLIAPVFVGGVVYLLILLVNNNIAQLKGEFFGEELYLCIGLAYVVQELNRGSIILFKFLKIDSWILELLIRLVASVLITGLIVWGVIIYYFKWRLGYAPNASEISIFIIIYGTIAIIYLVLYYGHYLLHRINTSLLEKEKEIREHLHHDFLSYTRDINPELLYEGLENIIVALRTEDIDRVDEIVDRLSYLYRFILARREKELVPFKVEYEALQKLVELNNLFYPGKIENNCSYEGNDWMVIPSSLVSIIDFLVRGSVSAADYRCDLNIEGTEREIRITMSYIGRIIEKDPSIIQYWKDRYKVFTDVSWIFQRDVNGVRLVIPVPFPVDSSLTIKTS